MWASLAPCCRCLITVKHSRKLSRAALDAKIAAKGTIQEAESRTYDMPYVRLQVMIVLAEQYNKHTYINRSWQETENIYTASFASFQAIKLANNSTVTVTVKIKSNAKHVMNSKKICIMTLNLIVKNSESRLPA